MLKYKYVKVRSEVRKNRKFVENLLIDTEHVHQSKGVVY